MQAENKIVNDITNATTTKPTWYQNDVWLFNDLGMDGKQADNHKSFSFKRILQSWLKDAIKRYTYHYSISKSCLFIEYSLSSLAAFSIYLDTLSNDIKPNSMEEIERETIVGYIAFLAKKSYANVTRENRILVLSRFLDVNYERGWIPYKGKLIYSEDLPPREKKAPRFIPDIVVKQFNENIHHIDPHVRRILLVLQETGMRINEAIKLRFNCIFTDKDGDYFLKYFQSKLSKDHIIPISLELASTIKEQQQAVCKEWGTHILLFPVPIYIQPIKSQAPKRKTKKAGEQWIRRTLARHLDSFAEYYKIVDENGNLWNFTFHQFRHTVATKMINNDVPQYIVQRYLGHESPTMTARYAHIFDQSLKKAFTEFNGKMINISGDVVQSQEIAMDIAKGTDPDDIDARWLKKNIMAQALPNGTCALPSISKSCPHANACLACTNFLTDHRHLNTHTQQLEKTKVMIKQAKENGWQRQLDMNLTIEVSLEKIIATLKEPK